MLGKSGKVSGKSRKASGKPGKVSGKSGKVSGKSGKVQESPEKCHVLINSLMMKNLIQSKFYLSLITAGELSGIDCNDLGLYGITSSRI